MGCCPETERGMNMNRQNARGPAWLERADVLLGLAVLGGALAYLIMRQLNQDRGIFIHGPKAFAALDALPHIFRGHLDVALVEEALADFFDTPVIAT